MFPARKRDERQYAYLERLEFSKHRPFQRVAIFRMLDIRTIQQHPTVEDSSGKIRYLGMHPVLRIQHVNIVPGLFQPLEKAAIVLSTSTRHVEDGRGKLLILKIRNAIGEELITNLDNPLR